MDLEVKILSEISQSEKSVRQVPYDFTHMEFMKENKWAMEKRDKQNRLLNIENWWLSKGEVGGVKGEIDEGDPEYTYLDEHWVLHVHLKLI